MSHDPPKPQQPRATAERTPIPIEKLIISHANPNGVRLPNGPRGESDKMLHTVKAGEESDVRTSIEYRPWMRSFRVVKERRVTKTVDKKEVVSYEPMGKPFYIPEAWAVWIPAEDM